MPIGAGRASENSASSVRQIYGEFKPGKNPEQIIFLLKSVWCDETQIAEFFERGSEQLPTQFR
jgi:hypothetical protein